MHSVEIELFNKYKARADKIITDLPHKVDPRILGLLAAINTNPHVATTWSCSGHTFSEVNEGVTREQAKTGDRRKRINPPDIRWYLTFVISPEGFEFIERLRKVVFDIDRETQHLLRPMLNMTALLDLFSDDDVYYNSWSFDGHFRENEKDMAILSDYWTKIADAIRV